MSKIGRKTIDTSGIQIEVKGQEVYYKGSKNSGVYYLPELLKADFTGNSLKLVPANSSSKIKPRELNRAWGLHRALLSNAVSGAKKEFEKIIEINGLGFKATQVGSKLVFVLGYSHKIDVDLPKGITVSIDKTAQKLTVKSFDRELLGQFCSDVCFLRVTEPYKGTGIKLSTDQILRKAGKTK